jgi:hypothetical protein
MARRGAAAAVWALVAGVGVVHAQDAAAGGCSLTSLQDSLATVDGACCAGTGECSEQQPFPRDCGWECATPFSDFWSACGGLLSASGAAGVEDYANFARRCQGTLRAGGPTTFNAAQLAQINAMIAAAVNASETAMLEEGGPVAAQCSVGADAAASNAASMDSAWLVLGGALVFFMHSGFALLEVGSVSQRNVQNILFKNAVSPTFAAILFWMFGYTFAFGGNGEGGFIGTRVRRPLPPAPNRRSLPAARCASQPLTTNDSRPAARRTAQDGWFLATENMFEPSGAGMPYNSKEYATWFFQWAFAATASTIVSGAVAERVNFQLYMVITVFLTGFIYPVVVHWQWGGGWSGAWGVLDFAGCGVVHMTGGIAALVATIFVGPRHGRFVTQFRYPAGAGGRWYVHGEELPLQAPQRTGWYGIEFGVTPADLADAVSGQIWTKLPNRRARPDLVEEERGICRALDELRANTDAKGRLDGAENSPNVRRFANMLPASSPGAENATPFSPGAI